MTLTLAPTPPLSKQIAVFAQAVTDKFAHGLITGDPEEQLRAPLEYLLKNIGQEIRAADGDKIVVKGEHRKSELKLRLDFVVTRGDELIGYVELKAPGKGADPRRFTQQHDKDQWEKLKSLPNLIYTDGNEFSLWHNGELYRDIIRLNGDVTKDGHKLTAPSGLLDLFQNFYQWEPIPPQSVPQLASVCAKLCRLLRDELAEQLGTGHKGLDALQQEWRELLFPDAELDVFADSFAQAVTFGMVLAKVGRINMKLDFVTIAHELSKQNSLIGSALRYISDDDEITKMLDVSLRTLRRVLDGFEWDYLGPRTEDAWLYFYEDFLAEYDAKLRKSTGSYYTPPEIVTAMIRLVDDTLRDAKKFNLPQGLAAPQVNIIDPAMGTGTYLLGIIRYIAKRVTDSEGAGSVKSAIKAALQRMIGFEIQFGPFVVAQTRLLSEFSTAIGEKLSDKDLRLFLDNTLEDPEGYVGNLPGIRGILARTRNQANQIKLSEDIMVVIGNPPYKEKAKGKGAWVESGSKAKGVVAPLDAWKDAPKEWKMGVHAHKLSNLYVYFWRWASWKVFGGAPILADGSKNPRQGLVCFITMTGFINGPGFQKMRADLRRDADEIWVINCAPEGMQAPVANAVFTQVQNPVCIMLATRLPNHDDKKPANVYYRELPRAKREEKFAALDKIHLGDEGWEICDEDWRSPFLPKISGTWSECVSLDSMFESNTLGVTPHRVWPIAPDKDSLIKRWRKLISEPSNENKSKLFSETPDRQVANPLTVQLFGFHHREVTILNETNDCHTPIPYSFRSFDRQYLIPDNRLIDRGRPPLWNHYSNQQVFLTAPSDQPATNGPGLVFCANIPDLHHYHGRGGRVFPLWKNAAATEENLAVGLREKLSEKYGFDVTGAMVMAYIAAIAAHPAYTAKFKADLQQPGLRIPLTASGELFSEAVTLGTEIIWLHCYGERYNDNCSWAPPRPPQEKSAGYPTNIRPNSPPRLPPELAPRHSGEHPIPDSPEKFPDIIDYNAEKNWLLVGEGVIENVPPAVWNYDVSGKKIIRQWFSYRKKNRERPIMGDRRTPSELGKIQPDHWLPEYTTDLLNLLHVLGRLVRLEPAQADMLNRICDGELISASDIPATKTIPAKSSRRKSAQEAFI